jgi:hypothetical protein
MCRPLRFNQGLALSFRELVVKHEAVPADTAVVLDHVDVGRRRIPYQVMLGWLKVDDSAVVDLD